MLEPAINHINDQLETLNLFKDLKGLVHIIQEEEKTFPAEYCTGDEYKQIDFDFKKGLV